MPEIQVSVPANSTVNEPLLIQRRPRVGINGIFSMWTLFLGLFAGRRGASLVVLGNVADHLESWRQSVGYSFPAVVIDTIWNLVFVIVSVAMLIWSKREKPNVPVRVWICVYALQCVVHVMLVWKEYKRRNRTVPIADGFVSSDSSSSSIEGDSTNTTPRRIRWERRWERRNTEISYIWWGIGFILMGIGNKHLLHVAPRLFWLTLVFLAIDAFFTAVYILMRCLLLLGVCFCFPFIIVFMYYMGLEEGASEADISVLPKYKFEMSNDEEQRHGRAGRMVPMGTNGPNFSVQRVLTKDADCCICLCSYENGSKLHLLPCNHHFHVACIRKWLKVKANCPLCKYDIAQNEQV